MSRVLQLRETVASAPSEAFLASLVASAVSSSLPPQPTSAVDLGGEPPAHPQQQLQARPAATPLSLAQRPQSAPVETSALRRAGVTLQPPSSSSLLSCHAAAVSTSVPTSAADPDLGWFQGHYYYARKVSNFFCTPATILSRSKTFNGQFASQTQELKDRIEKKETPKSMKAFHSSLFNKVSPIGLISISEVVDFFRSSLPPMQVAAADEYLMRFATLRCGPVFDESFVAYVDVSAALEELLTGKTKDAVMLRCFQLCDPGRTGYILKSTLRALPATEEAEGGATTDFHYLIAQALWRAFGKIAKAEEDKAQSGKGKGKGKKGGKGGKGGASVGGMKQFHISYDEFVKAMEDDPYVASSFFPFIIKIAPSLS